MSLLISSHIYRDSVNVFEEHRKLLVFPALTLLMALVFCALFLLPLLQLTATEVWSWMWHPLREQAAVRAHWQAAPRLRDLPLAAVAALYLSGSLAVTFLNVALYSQALNALNGGNVSITRGFAIAVHRLPAITAWALFDSTVGVVLRALTTFVGAVGPMLMNVLGIAWQAAEQFVIPIMINEPRNRGPIEYLRISARVLRPAWGDGLALGRVGPNYKAGLWIMCIMFVFWWLAVVMHQYALVLWGVLIVAGIGCVVHALHGVFLCGLYIFTTEGVVPGPFDAEAFERSWTVRSGHAPGAPGE